MEMKNNNLLVLWAKRRVKINKINNCIEYSCIINTFHKQCSRIALKTIQSALYIVKKNILKFAYEPFLLFIFSSLEIFEWTGCLNVHDSFMLVIFRLMKTPIPTEIKSKQMQSKKQKEEKFN